MTYKRSIFKHEFSLADVRRFYVKNGGHSPWLLFIREEDNNQFAVFLAPPTMSADETQFEFEVPLLGPLSQNENALIIKAKEVRKAKQLSIANSNVADLLSFFNFFAIVHREGQLGLMNVDEETIEAELSAADGKRPGLNANVLLLHRFLKNGIDDLAEGQKLKNG